MTAPAPPPPPPPEEDGKQEEAPPAKPSPEKPKLPPKPAIAPKPAGLSPTHKPTAAAEAAKPQPPPAAAVRKPVASPRKRTGASAENNPAHCEIVPGADTTIEITKVYYLEPQMNVSSRTLGYKITVT